jgi:hypothetical protein
MRPSAIPSKSSKPGPAGGPAQEAAALRAEALKCRRLGRGMADQSFCETLLAMADEYEAKAEALLRKPT